MMTAALADHLRATIGRPWSRRWTCWHLAHETQALLGRDLPLPPRIPVRAEKRHAAIHGHHAFALWREVAGPAHGAVVLMSRCPAPRRDEHAGTCLFLPMPQILHVIAPQGCLLESPERLGAQGWSLAYYMPNEP